MIKVSHKLKLVLMKELLIVMPSFAFNTMFSAHVETMHEIISVHIDVCVCVCVCVFNVNPLHHPFSNFFPSVALSKFSDARSTT